MAKTKKQTKAPNATKITRNNRKFTLTWKITCDNCEEQQVRFKIYDYAGGQTTTLTGDWIVATIGKAKTSYTITIPSLNYYYPNGINKLYWVKMGVRCKRSDTDKYNFTYSDWSTLTFSVSNAPKPTLSVENTAANQTKFTWERSYSADDKYAMKYVAYRSYLSTESVPAWTFGNLSGNKTYTDTATNVTRYFQACTMSAKGASDIVTKSHYIGAAPTATINGLQTTYTDKGTYYQISFTFTLSGSSTSIDSITPQYYIGQPDSDLSCPSDASWEGSITMSAKSGTNKYTCVLNTSTKVSTDECLWVRVVTTHDSQDTASDASCLIYGYLSDATSVTVSSIAVTDDNVTATMSAEWDSIDGSYAKAYLIKGSAPNNLLYVGDITTSGSSLSVNYDTDMSSETEYSLGVQIVSADGTMTSENIVYYTAITPKAPNNVTVTTTATSGKVLISWDGSTWASATGVQLSWSEDADAWTSTDEPSTFEIESADFASWYISGLDTGTTYYFKVRLLQTSDDVTLYGPWSDMVSIDLSSAPDTPVLTLSDSVVNYGDTVTAYWGYVTTDGTSQFAAEIVQAVYSDGAWSYSSFSPQITSGTAQYVDIDTETQGWTTGTSRYLALMVVSASGNSSEYSEPVLLTVAEPAECSITSTTLASTDTLTEYFDGDGETTVFSTAYNINSITTVTIDDTETADYTFANDEITFTTAPSGDIAVTYAATVNTLTELPLTVNTSGTEGGTLSIIIERAQSCPMERPDGVVTTNPEGETIAVVSTDSESTNSVIVDVANLIGSLDDGCLYTLTATITDEYGQTASDSVDFTVHWTHQAITPSGYVGISTSQLAAIITVNSVDGSASGDVVDIYRLSLDKPELIYSGANFGDVVVDPYPTLNENGGHRLVYRTANGDYATEDGIAQVDFTSEDGDILKENSMVIDFENQQILLPYNISLSNQWTKDFERSTYLGGSVVGDWNKAVTRDLSAGAEVVRLQDTETIQLMRELARYPGICHVRTPDGSSFSADVQVQENQEYSSSSAVFSLTIAKVDSAGTDGIIYEDWL